MDKKEKLLIILIVTFGFLLRIWRLRELMGFDYDQEVAAFAVERILSGKLTLIGQQTSVGGVFIGPGYYYLLSLFYWLFKFDPIGVGVMVALISVATMYVLFLAVKELFDKKTAFIALLLYASSLKINFFDRTTAPSNPLMLVSLLTIYFLLRIRQGKAWYTPLLIATVLVAIIHFHPSAVALLPLVSLLWIVWKLPPPSLSNTVAGLAAGLIIISPLLVFDLRHDFLNLKGIISSLGTPGEEAYFFPFKLLLTLRIQLENLASLFSLKRGFSIVLALATIIFWEISEVLDKRLIWFWILVPSLVFAFYSRHIPEYYFLISLPALLILIARSLRLVAMKWSEKISYLLLVLIVILNLKAISEFVNPYGLKYKQEAVNFISKQKDSEAVVSFDTDLGLEAGFRFLLKQAGIAFDSYETPTHTIIVPPHRRQAPGKEHTFGGVKVIESEEVK